MDADRRRHCASVGVREDAGRLCRGLGAQAWARQAQFPTARRVVTRAWLQPLPRLRSGSDRRYRGKREIRHHERCVRPGARRIHLARTKVQLHGGARIALLSQTTVKLSATESRKLPREFYARPVLLVARECIGKVLVHRTGQGIAAGRVVEVEAYRGPLDLAAHSARGLTKRTAAMYGPPGYAYVYLLYGISWAINIVTTADGEPHAVLIRAIEPLRGIALMARRRGKSPDSRELTNGPGKLTNALAITGADYGRDLCGGQLYLEHSDLPVGKVGRSPRINVDYAGDWALKRWRFYERGNRYVSVAPRD